MTDQRLDSLRLLLIDHQPADHRESGYLDAMLGLLSSQGHSFSRSHFDPGHFTASGFVLAPDRPALLLVHHAKLGKWLQPGGHIETDDADVEAAARREVAEETGLEDLEALGLLDLDIHRFPQRGEEPAHDHLDVRFGFLAGSWEVDAGDGATEVGWFRLTEAASWEDRPSLSRPARKLLKRSI